MKAPGNGERAYHLRRLLGLRWADIAERLGYRPFLSRELRGERMCLTARKWAVRAGEPWPLPRKKADAETTSTEAET